jgi:hypothetical protein
MFFFFFQTNSFGSGSQTGSNSVPPTPHSSDKVCDLKIRPLSCAEAFVIERDLTRSNFFFQTFDFGGETFTRESFPVQRIPYVSELQVSS